jgi:hypothetical protein
VDNFRYLEIIGYQFGAKFKLVFCVKYDRELDLGFWEILKPLKWTNITSFFLIKTNGILIMIFGIDNQTGFQRSPSLSKKKLSLSENK